MPHFYETDRLLSEYLLMHYGSDQELMPWGFGPKDAIGFPVRTVGYVPENNQSGRALDLGCAVGRSSFELSKSFEEVLGIDFSAAFIKAANEMKRAGQIHYQQLETGKVTRPALAEVPAGSRRQNVSFQRGDAMNLPADLGVFDLVHAANLICRLPQPEKLLSRLPDLISEGGHLVLATPCTWLDEFTPPENQPQSDTLEWLKKSLDAHFTMVSSHDEPFLIRETARKYQWTVSLVTVWMKK